MANPEHVNILKRGAQAWNRWRKDNPGVRADLTGVELDGAELDWAELGLADLRLANLRFANLDGANLGGAHLDGAQLGFAHLTDARLTGADLGNSDFTNAFVGFTAFGDNDLSTVQGLETVPHFGPSTIGVHTIYKSKGNIPEAFLRGAGVPEDFIVYMKSLAGNPIEFYSCFISYSSQDDDFARRLHADLRENGVRCWFAPEDLKIGDRFRTRIDESIHVYDKLMVILTEHSIASPCRGGRDGGGAQKGAETVGQARVLSHSPGRRRDGDRPSLRLPACAARGLSATFATGRITMRSKRPSSDCCGT